MWQVFDEAAQVLLYHLINYGSRSSTDTAQTTGQTDAGQNLQPELTLNKYSHLIGANVLCFISDLCVCITPNDTADALNPKHTGIMKLLLRDSDVSQCSVNHCTRYPFQSTCQQASGAMNITAYASMLHVSKST